MNPAIAANLAERHLATALPRRWAHVQAVANVAESIASIVGEDGDVLCSAAWLHDMGYASEAKVTGLHSLDGARYLRAIGVDDRLASLVAYHSNAVVEATELGLEQELSREFESEVSPLSDALWYCDLTTGPDGQRCPVSNRLREVTKRYGPGHVVTRSVQRASTGMIAAVNRTAGRAHRAGLAL